MKAVDTENSKEVRFEFGKNWSKFSDRVTDSHIDGSTNKLKDLIKKDNLSGKSFIDVGSGSGLHSLAARKLGAQVYSFDYDLQSVQCTKEFKNKYFKEDPLWTVTQGSILDKGYIESLGQFDIVYSWGVLHHTGDMQRAFENIIKLVKPGGKLVIAIYNDQGFLSDYWKVMKKLYCQNKVAKKLLPIAYWPYFVAFRKTLRWLRGQSAYERGMDFWHDLLDWLGGYPFEVASATEIHNTFEKLGFKLIHENLVGTRNGCNEFLFIK